MIDISVPLCINMDVYEGDPKFEVSPICSIDAGDDANVSKLTFSSHAGTHIDAPSHYINGALTIDKVDITKLCGPCEVVEIDDASIKDNLIVKIPKLTKERVLFKTRNSKTPGKFSRDLVALSLEVTKQLVQSNVVLIGVDGFSVEIFGGNGDVHREILSNEIVIVETLDLSKVTPGVYELLCLPVKITDCDAAPARAFLKPI